MNENLKNETKAYIDRIKKTDAYVDYLNYKSILERQPELKAQVDAFRRKSFEIQAGHKYGYFNAYENLLNLRAQNNDLLNEAIVKSFLAAELKVSKMLTDILTTFAEEVDFDLDFLQE
ncbi:MAG: hypothetical protein CVU95_09140 [Firmicutes bacterium HGW-Firmicutes-2]|jgi:cell fate (sporulation/competence/biofilm development) regulator YlbF (YheA/YmcA/DUF963 family)|nr:MAG: hypothetical protein CVU95_09140 [Firmicutes bacterium HGW-Firmicutes-2]